ncbi:MAG: ATP-binding protein, partial [Candidatus Zipacnadales bacterium]
MLLSVNLVSEQGRVIAEAIVGLAKRATGLTRQLLAFSRQQPVRPSSLNVNQLVESQTRLLRRLLGEDVELITELDPTIGTTYADEGQIEQVLMNLLVNARDAMPEGGRVTITTAAVKVDENGGELSTEVEPGWYVRLSVSDTGVGMDKATRERIFEPFFSTKPIGKGTGLGLATVYKIVKRHGGHIAVDSTPGKGTSFHVYLPIDDTASALKATYSSTEVPRGDGQTILIVEDEKSVLNVATRALRSQGYNVLSAPGPAEAENLFQQQEDKIDLLLTDVVMPSTSGPQLYKRLVARQPSLKVLYMSGYPQHPADRALELTPDTPFIPKPFTPAELAQQVHAILQGVNVIN